MFDDIRIKGTIPFLKGKSVLLMEEPARPIPVPEYYWEELKYRLERHGYHFIVLPELLSGLNPVLADYLFPGYDLPDATAIYRQISDLAGIPGRNGFLYKKGRHTCFKEISSDVDGTVSDLLSQLQESIRPRRVSKAKSPGAGIFGSILFERPLELYDEAMDSCREVSEPCAPCIPTGAVPVEKRIERQEDLDPRTLFILDEVDRLLRENNLTLDELKVIIGYKVKLSRMQITRTGKIYLPDFLDKETGQPREVKMDFLTKMLYFFFLKHPEGVRIKEVGDYMAELMHLYMGITGRDDKEAIRASILGHVDPFGNSINVSMSRIKAAFKNQMDESVARYYWVEGKGGEPYRVAIDRDYVLWEYEV